MSTSLQCNQDTYLCTRPDTAHSGQVSAKCSARLLWRVAGRQVVAWSNDTDSIRSPRENSMFNLNPELICTCPWSGHDAKAVAFIWHLHKTICKGTQMGRTDKKNELQQKK